MQQGRLAGPVRPDETDLFARADLEGHAVQDGLRSEVFYDVGDVENEDRPPRVGGGSLPDTSDDARAHRQHEVRDVGGIVGHRFLR